MLHSLRQALYGHVSWKRRHNNRKMTKGRKQQRHIQGNRRGYLPQFIVRNKKLLDRYKKELQRLKDLPNNEKIDKIKKIAFFEHLIRKTETKLKRYQTDAE